MRVIFVHGAAVTDADWWWSRMRQPLRERGLRTAAVELPSCEPSGGDLHADGDAVQDVLGEDDEPAVLVGHSYGGMVITDAGEHSTVRGLIYVSAILPDAGESLFAMADPRSPRWLEPTGDGRLQLRSDLSTKTSTPTSRGTATMTPGSGRVPGWWHSQQPPLRSHHELSRGVPFGRHSCCVPRIAPLPLPCRPAGPSGQHTSGKFPPGITRFCLDPTCSRASSLTP